MARYLWPRTRKSGDSPQARMRYNAATNGVLPEDAVSAARVARKLHTLAAPAIAPSGDLNLWVPIGPSTVLKGQAGGNPRVTGRVRDLWVSPDGLRAYAGSANGGVWFSNDGGNTWSPLGNWLATPAAADVSLPSTTLTCGCLLVNFGNQADGSADEIYVGTGELRPDRSGTPGSQLGGVGVLRLADPVPQVLADPFGQHWKREAKNLANLGIYRLARHPTDPNQMVAATSVGLFKRATAGFTEDSDWTRVTADPFNFDTTAGKRVTDVLWVATAPKPRLFVALVGSSGTDVYTSVDGADGAYTSLSLPNVIEDQGNGVARLALAAAPSDTSVVYVLGSGPLLWRVNGTSVTQIQDLPKDLFGGKYGQSFYDMAIAVRPDNKDMVAVGGSTISSDSEWSGSIFQFTIAPAAGGGVSAGFQAANQASPDQDPTFIGTGVHGDIHQIRFIAVGTEMHMWVTCDGGIFRSTQAGQRYTFVNRNDGLAVLEPGYVASHPDNDAFVIAGAQDDGLLMRMGDTVWVHSRGIGGDAGCGIFHPNNQRFFAAQYNGAEWHSNGTLSPPVIRQGKNAAGQYLNPSEGRENQRASFYSGGDARSISATQARLAIGTNRVWLADNWNPTQPTNWVTLPSNTDPRRNNGTDDTTDRYGDGTGSIISCKWVDNDRLMVLIRARRGEGGDSAVLLCRRKPDGTWERIVISEHSNKKSDYENGNIEQPTSPIMPPLGPWSDLAVHDPARGKYGSAYVAVTGDGTSDRMDTLWWFDGTDTWYPAKLRSSDHGTKAPAYAVVVDPADNTTLYVGTALGVWRGTQAFAGTTPGWAWEPFSNGLPEAAVQDVSIYRVGDVKILRAAIQARGVWEVDLSATPAPTKRTFLRVHPNDARRTAATTLTNPMNEGPVTWRWYASPDMRIRPARIGLGETPPAAPPTLTWVGNAPNRYQLWIFQTAFHAVDPVCRANGVWDNQFADRLRQENAASGNTIDNVRWTRVVTEANVYAAPWEGLDPTEADLFELVVEDGFDPETATVPPPPPFSDWPSPPPVSRVDQRKYVVDVLVHYRDLRPLAKDQVRVTLLMRPLPADNTQWAGIAMSEAWKSAVGQLMSGGPAPALPDNWSTTDAAFSTRPLRSDIDARTPRAVTFDADFTSLATGQYAVLLAIVHSTPDPVTAASLTGATLGDLVLNCHQVAVRIVMGR